MTNLIHTPATRTIITDIFEQAHVKPSVIEPLSGGAENIVCSVETADAAYVIRLNRDYSAIYHKEEWAMVQASAAGVPVPKVHAVGQQGGYDYILMDRIAGIVGSEYQGDLEAVYGELGRLTRLINDIPVEGYGWNLEFTPQARFTETWTQVADHDEQFIFGGDVMQRLNILNAAEAAKVREIIIEYRTWTYPPRLTHGDMCLDNLIVGTDGQVYLIDWGDARGQPAPFFDMANIDGATAQPAYRQAFVQGYGLSEAEWKAIEPKVTRYKLIYALRAIVWADARQSSFLQEFIDNARRLIHICT